MSDDEKSKPVKMRNEVDKFCLHCKEPSRRPLSSANFSRHLRDFHSERYNEL